MIRPNAWTIEIKIPKVDTYKTTDGSKQLKEKLSENASVLGWAKRGREVYLVTDNPEVRAQFNTSETSFDDLHWSVRNKLLFYIIQSKFKRVGFIDIGRGSLFLPKSNDHASHYSYDQEIQSFINFAFSFTIAERKRQLLLVVNPRRVITQDGENYDSDYSREKNRKLLETKNGQFRYDNRLNVIDMFKSKFGNYFSLEINSKSRLSFKLHDDISNEIEVISEPEISFGNRKKHSWPKAGLSRYGPLDQNETFENRPRSIEICLVGTKKSFDLLEGLNNGVQGGKNSYQGFEEVYTSKLKMGKTRFSEIESKEIRNVESQSDIVSLILQKAIQIRNSGHLFDICIIELVPEWDEYFYTNGTDLHDLLKVEFSKEGIKTQIITENSEDNVISATLENLALGLYFKSGGNPWKVETRFKDIAYIGISFGYSKKENKRLIGIAEIFDNYGQFISLRSISLKEISNDEFFDRGDHHLSKDQLSTLVEKLMEDYRKTLDGNYPKNLVIHKTNRFNNEEKDIAEYFDNYPFDLSLIHIQTDHEWHLLKEKEPTRGTYWEIANTTALLYTAGILDKQSKYFLPGSPLPLILNEDYSDNFSLRELAEQILVLTKLNFNSTNSYSKDPVTILHSRKIVALLRAGMSNIDIPKDPRYFL